MAINGPSDIDKRDGPDDYAGTLADPGPFAYGYRRCSHEQSQKTQIGLDGQIIRVEAYYAQFVRNNVPDITWGAGGNDYSCQSVRDGRTKKFFCPNCNKRYLNVPYVRNCLKPKPGVSADRPGWFVDEVTSASMRPFNARRGGALLWRALRAGDHVIFAKLDRAFRNVADRCDVMDQWKEKGVTVHFAELGPSMQSANAHNTLMLNVLTSVHQMQAEIAREHSLQTFARLIARGQPTGRVPVGMKRVRRADGTKQDVMCWATRAVMRAIVEIRDRDGSSWDEISDEIEKRAAIKENRKPLLRGFGRKWNQAKCNRAYTHEMEFRAKAKEKEEMEEKEKGS